MGLYLCAMRLLQLSFLLFSLAAVCSGQTREHEAPLVARIAFGSCGHQDEPQPILSLAAAKNPDLFIWLGDNIYGDTKDMKVLREKYQLLGSKQEFQNLKKKTSFLATWDDHDFGWNDSGRHYAYKKESKELFLSFFEIPAQDVRRKREGIYTSYYYSNGQKTLQVILLDTRTFRDDLRLYKNEKKDTYKYFYDLDYWPYETKDSTLLGKQQWDWLEKELQQPADLRLICSSTQFSIEFNGYEAWANFPHERDRMVQLIKKTKANGVFFISGDVHYAEISNYPAAGVYPLYDFTASGITSTWSFATPNAYRVDGPTMDNHFGIIDINWYQQDPEITMQCIDIRNHIRFERKIKLSEISFSKDK